MSMNPTLGYLRCPQCEKRGLDTIATIHREKRGRRAYYYRCYEDDGMTEICGTVQPRGPGGQLFIKAVWQGSASPVHGQENAAAPAPEKPEKPKRRSALAAVGRLLADDEDDD